MVMAEQEGVIKFHLSYQPAEAVQVDDILDIDAWRHLCYRLQLIGQDPSRYLGYGFGNISKRIRPATEAFIISGTQTGHLPMLGAEHYALVTRCEPLNNYIEATGLCKPSSEAMTHGQVYQLAPEANCVIHAHCPEIWQAADRLGLMQTHADVPYGTVQMAMEVERLFAETAVVEQGIFSMAGHEDGIVAFASSFNVAMQILQDALAKALQLQIQESK